MTLFQDRIEKRKLVREQQIAERAIREKKRQEEEKAERIRKEEEEERKKKEEEEKKKNALAAMSMNFGGAAQRQNNRKGKVKFNSYYPKTSGFFQTYEYESADQSIVRQRKLSSFIFIGLEINL